MPKNKFFKPEIDKDLHDRLIELFSTWKKKPLNPMQLAKTLSLQKNLETRAGRDPEKTTQTNLPHNQIKKNISGYLELLEEARCSLLNLPDNIQRELTGIAIDIGEGFPLMKNIDAGLKSTIYKEQADLAQWRKCTQSTKPGLATHDSWGIDVEMLDTLIEIARRWALENPEIKYQRSTAKIDLVRYIAERCTEQGIKVSTSERSYFYQIIREFFYPIESDFRDLIRKAIAHPPQ